MRQARRNLALAASALAMAGVTARARAEDPKTGDFLLVQTAKGLTFDAAANTLRLTGVSPITLFVTAQVPRDSQASRRRAIRCLGSLVRVWSRSQPCFLAVERSERITAKSSAPASERKPPEIFCRSFIIRPSRSTRLLVKGTRGSVRKRSTSCLRVL